MDQSLFLKDDMDYGMSESVTQDVRATVGQCLFEARRVSRETDLEKISGELCIRPHLLRALEQDDFDKFPSACYAAGFLKNYASYLGLNVGKITAQYKREFHGSTKKVDLVFLEVEKGYNHAQQRIISLALLSAIVFYGVWYFASGNDRFSLSALPDVSEVTSNILVSATTEDEIPAPVTIEVTDQDQGFHLVQPANATPLESATTTMGVAAEQVRLSVREDSWIRIISADQQILVDRILLAGEEFYLTEREGMTLMTNNAGAVSLFIGDVAISLLGEPGEIRDNISLNRQDLLTKIAQLSP